MLETVGKAALAECGGQGIEIDAIGVVRLFADSGGAFRGPFGHYTNLPKSLARRLGQTPTVQIYGPVGGNTPQAFVNTAASRIRQGDYDVALIAGAEALRTQAKAQKAGVMLDWSEDTGDVADSGSYPAGERLVSRHELAHGIGLPIHIYPMFENALRAHYGRTVQDHMAAVGALMSGFTRVAAQNPYAALPVERSAEELITPTDVNRMIAYPYTKYLNSNMFVDQAAALLMMSTEAADRAGVPENKRVYLHGCADTHEKILISDRTNYAVSSAVRVGAAHALAQAGLTVADLDHIELYSCFPVAVEIAADMIGLAHDDPRGLTLTGGLPYFGGPGNNYAMHGIAEMVGRCRAAPGSNGLVFANGGYMTKNSFGVYSTTPTPDDWARTDPAVYQAEINAMVTPAFTQTPVGTGRIETFTIVYAGGHPAYAIIIGRLDDDTRFLAQMHERLDELIDTEVIGRRIAVTTGSPANTAVFV